eukprot:TRINITY_DN63588_c0_g1_i1.p1 TRINITY_DN63588_c0_g1~~TRINITY_DN63588_c0_g1_i1.p1  ORF type:complete len:547 (-),score=105.56 TRINITY_DN63588_c0_g1_i1:20-1660(-)
MLKTSTINSVLNRHGYSQINWVGEGSFGAALLVHQQGNRTDDGKAVIKTINLGGASEKEQEDALKESQVLALLHHPYIVRYQESFEEEGHLWIVMDYCVGGNLCDLIKTMPPADVKFPEELVMRWFTQAILGLQYLHGRHILHRDLKSSNFFVTKTGAVKMGDFGLAKVLECTADFAHTRVGTPNYMPPEICRGKPYHRSCDLWSMGVVLFEMCARHLPFEAPNLKKLVQWITRGPIPDLPAEYSDALRVHFRGMLEREPEMRPSADQILASSDVQAMVRKLAEQEGSPDSSHSTCLLAQADIVQGKWAVPRNPGGADAAAQQQQQQQHRSRYCVREEVEYLSGSTKKWIPATVIKVDVHGHVTLDVKPHVPLPVPVQETRVRPARAAAASRAKQLHQQQRLGGRPRSMASELVPFKAPVDTETMMMRVLGRSGLRPASRGSQEASQQPSTALAKFGLRAAATPMVASGVSMLAMKPGSPEKQLCLRGASSAANLTGHNQRPEAQRGSSAPGAFGGGSAVGLSGFRRIQGQGRLIAEQPPMFSQKA